MRPPCLAYHRPLGGSAERGDDFVIWTVYLRNFSYNMNAVRNEENIRRTGLTINQPAGIPIREWRYSAIREQKEKSAPKVPSAGLSFSF
jgi:hypothetical protein